MMSTRLVVGALLMALTGGVASTTSWRHCGKTIIRDEDGDLALARLATDGMTGLARASLFETVAWTAPTLEKIVALDLEAE